MVYVWHHVVTILLAAAAAWALARARWTHRSPRLAVLLWHASVWGVVTGAVGLLLSAGLAPYGKGIVPALADLGADVVNGTPLPGTTPAHLAAVTAGLCLAVAVLAAHAHTTWRLRRQRSRHDLLLRIVARADAHDRAFVLDHPAVAAYYLPGRAGRVVVSSGAINALTDRELAAVLAHEDAHARGRHHLLLAPFHALRRALPCTTTARAAESVELLVEMCADDGAARRHGTAAVAAALHRFRELGDPPVPPGALAAAEHGIAQRIDRLRGGRGPLGRPLALALTLTALAVATTPASLFVLPA